MHPQIENLAYQAHVDDLRREADRHRREARLLRRRTRAEGRVAAPALSPQVHEVLVFAEHQPTRRQLDQLLAHLQSLQDEVVTTLLHHRPMQERMAGNEAGAHSLSLPTPEARLPAQRAPSEAEQHLSEVVGVLRAAGHDTNGALVSGSLGRVLADEVRDRHPEAVIVLTDRHRLAHLARRDVERRLRRSTSVPVIAVTEGRRPHLV